MKNLKVFVFLFFVVLFAGCQNQLQDIGKEAKMAENNPASITKIGQNIELDYDEINANIDEFAKTLAQQMANPEMRALIKKEAMKKFDGDFDILYKNFKNLSLKNGLTVESHLLKSNAETRTHASKIPKFQISVPVNCESWDTDNYVPLVAIVPQGIQESEMEKFKAFDAQGNVYWLDAKTTPKFPVVAVGMNERTDLEGNVAEGYLRKPQKGASNGRIDNSAEYLGRIYMPEPWKYETWVQGAMDFRLTISTTNDFQTVYKPQNNSPYSAGCQCVQDHNGNYALLRGCLMGDFLFTWDLSYSPKVSYYWIEEDGGIPADIPLTIGFPTPAGIINLTTTIPKQSWDDDLGERLINRVENSGQRYGSSSVFEFQINF